VALTPGQVSQELQDLAGRIASRKNVTRAGLLPHEISYRNYLIPAVSGRRGRPCVSTQTRSSPST
ncbi:MAG: hypothetical protein LC769_13830, partial [Chloroflexi bacterium]|nr:hypothetical protein [Chloroflexota bacterium]